MPVHIEILRMLTALTPEVTSLEMKKSPIKETRALMQGLRNVESAIKEFRQEIREIYLSEMKYRNPNDTTKFYGVRKADHDKVWKN